jgi:hypothetical protein
LSPADLLGFFKLFMNYKIIQWNLTMIY